MRLRGFLYGGCEIKVGVSEAAAFLCHQCGTIEPIGMTMRGPRGC